MARGQAAVQEVRQGRREGQGRGQVRQARGHTPHTTHTSGARSDAASVEATKRASAPCAPLRAGARLGRVSAPEMIAALRERRLSAGSANATNAGFGYDDDDDDDDDATTTSPPSSGYASAKISVEDFQSVADRKTSSKNPRGASRRERAARRACRRAATTGRARTCPAAAMPRLRRPRGGGARAGGCAHYVHARAARARASGDSPGGGDPRSAPRAPCPTPGRGEAGRSPGALGTAVNLRERP